MIPRRGFLRYTAAASLLAGFESLVPAYVRSGRKSRARGGPINLTIGKLLFDGGGAMHGPDKHGPGNSVGAMAPANRLGEPGTGLENMPWRVLVYTDLESLTPGTDRRPPEREIEIHATGNMERYMWSFDGKKYSEAMRPIAFNYGERLRFTWVNDTMMEHPLHLHGMFMELDNGHGAHKPRKHTIILKPGEKLSSEITVDAPGLWAFHCHVLYHMEVGMFRVVSVAPKA